MLMTAVAVFPFGRGRSFFLFSPCDELSINRVAVNDPFLFFGRHWFPFSNGGFNVQKAAGQLRRVATPVSNIPKPVSNLPAPL